jgi:FtsP/CotA-like multicopper oxidase with cupredoxin domain
MIRYLLIAMVLLVSIRTEAGVTRVYYIAAEEVLWDYAPSYPINPMHKGEFSEAEKTFVAGNGQDRIGHRYRKARFVEYLDGGFGKPKPRSPEWEHLGILGPVIRANVGDTVKVVFRNKTADLRTSIHAHGVFYRKDSEGVPYHDDSPPADQQDDAIPPGGTWTYTWEVPERAGPGPRDPSSIVWLYHSHVDETRDTNTGLIGPIIISRRGELLPDGKLRGVDREFVVLFNVFDENESLYLDRNIAEFAPAAADKRDDEAFEESNRMHAMNGYVYDNIPGLRMKVGENVRWYQLALGTEVDLHTPHWHANTLLSAGQRVDVLNLLPGSHVTVDMQPDNPGAWMYHCHVNDHIEAGMMGRYVVEPKGK